MEIRSENTLSIKEIMELKKYFEEYFKVDINVTIYGNYVYFRDN